MSALFQILSFVITGDLKKIERKKQKNNGSKTTQKLRRDDNEQVTYDLI